VELSVVNLDGTTGQQLAVSEDVFATAFREPLVHQVVVAYMSGTRSGTSSQKNRSAVSGGGEKHGVGILLGTRFSRRSTNGHAADRPNL